MPPSPDKYSNPRRCVQKIPKSALQMVAWQVMESFLVVAVAQYEK
jgi:hypothetical protein